MVSFTEWTLAGFNGFLFNNRGNVLIGTLFATPNRRTNVFRGNAFVSLVFLSGFNSILFFVAIPLSGRATFDIPTVDGDGRVKTPGLGIRVIIADGPLSNRGILVCFCSYKYKMNTEN